jgi:hypothetical protein
MNLTSILEQPEGIPEGWEQPVIAPYLPKAGSPVPSCSVAVIGTYADGLNRPGKVTGALFFPIFDYAAVRREGGVLRER